MSIDAGQTLIFLDHAKERMEQRGISPAEVEEALVSATVLTPANVPGQLALTGTTATGKPLRLMRLEHFPVIVSVVSLEVPPA